MKIVAFIASRLGSTRVPFKNVRLLNGKPMFTYLTESALNVKGFDEVYLNSDSELIIEIANEYISSGLKTYLRSKELGTSSASLDSYVYDFVKNVESDIVVFLNPCSPFLESKTIDDALEIFKNEGLKSMVASAEAQTHGFVKNEPVNFSFDAPQPRSQDLESVHLMTSGFFIWKTEDFIQNYEKNGFANFSSPFKSYPLNKLESIDIDDELDWLVAEAVSKSLKVDTPKEYHPIVSDMIKKGNIKVN